MIEWVDFDSRPFQPGESRVLHVQASAPTVIEVKCFVEHPPPAGYRGCTECGKLVSISSEDDVVITASAKTFARTGGYLEVAMQDADGDQRVIRAMVTRGTDAASGTENAMTIG